MLIFLDILWQKLGISELFMKFILAFIFQIWLRAAEFFLGGEKKQNFSLKRIEKTCQWMSMLAPGSAIILMNGSRSLVLAIMFHALPLTSPELLAVNARVIAQQ